MGLVLTILYIVLTIISPSQFGPAWANYHALMYLAVITALFSLPNVLSRSSLFSSVQSHLLLAFIFIVSFSQIANHWLGGALQAWLAFLPSTAVFFFIVANVTTVHRLKIVTLATVAACLGLVAEAFCGYYAGFLDDTFVLKTHVDAGQLVEQLPRLRAVGLLNDPNDFSQILIIALALLFVAWRQGRLVSNAVFVLAPSAALLWAIYLTHSRGALIGLAVLVLMAGYKRIGKVPALVLSGIFGLGLMALDFTGGRAIDPSAGADRLELWAEGLEAFKHSPIFGIGFGKIDLGGHTAHNSFVLPLVELGIIGATIFVALLVTTTLDLNRLIALREPPLVPVDSPAPASAPTDASCSPNPAPSRALDPPETPFRDESPVDPIVAYSVEPYSPAELPERLPLPVARPDQVGQEPTAGNLYREAAGSEETVPFSPEWLPATDADPVAAPAPASQSANTAAIPQALAPGNPLSIIRAALVSFMATGWFLSRTYDTTIYFVLGLAVASIGLEPAAQPCDHRRGIAWTIAVEAFLIVFVYLVVRLRHY
jgi:O-antigen ligase